MTLKSLGLHRMSARMLSALSQRLETGKPQVTVKVPRAQRAERDLETIENPTRPLDHRLRSGYVINLVRASGIINEPWNGSPVAQHF